MAGARAGWCDRCGADVWLRPGGGCVNGHEPGCVRTAREVPLPAELDRFNWGAFFFPVLWPLFKGPVRWAAIMFGAAILARIVDFLGGNLPAVTLATNVAVLGLNVWYARNANRVLWETRPQSVDVAALRKAMRNWGQVGAIIAAIVGLFVVAAFIGMPGLGG